MNVMDLIISNRRGAWRYITQGSSQDGHFFSLPNINLLSSVVQTADRTVVMG